MYYRILSVIFELNNEVQDSLFKIEKKKNHMDPTQKNTVFLKILETIIAGHWM